MTRRWPAIPKVIYGAGGPIRVRLIKHVLSDDREACWGTWSAGERVVRLTRAATLEHRWRTLFHELAHAALDDSGLTNLFSPAGNEALCDAVANARLQEMRGALGFHDPT